METKYTTDLKINVIEKFFMKKLGRPKDERTRVKVIIEPFNNKSINYSIRLKDGVSIADGLQEIIKQLENK